MTIRYQTFAILALFSLLQVSECQVAGADETPVVAVPAATAPVATTPVAGVAPTTAPAVLPQVPVVPVAAPKLSLRADGKEKEKVKDRTITHDFGTANVMDKTQFIADFENSIGVERPPLPGLKHDFVLQNTTKTAITISALDTDCVCTKAEVVKKDGFADLVCRLTPLCGCESSSRHLATADIKDRKEIVSSLCNRSPDTEERTGIVAR